MVVVVVVVGVVLLLVLVLVPHIHRQHQAATTVVANVGGEGCMAIVDTGATEAPTLQQVEEEEELEGQQEQE